jgi:polyribonucleotide nucleotidyltransferase
MHILDKMLEALAVPREEHLSLCAERLSSIKINPDKIRDVIGPGGKVIRAIQSETNTKIEIDDSGRENRRHLSRRRRCGPAGGRRR